MRKNAMCDKPAECERVISASVQVTCTISQVIEQ